LPWCEDCSKFWEASSLGEGGQCPTCDAVITKPKSGVPWHFKVLLIGLTGYMIYRIYWLAEWLPKHI
jgi:hypothetical protein